MKSDVVNDNLFEKISEVLFSQSPDKFRSILENLLNRVMEAERISALGAEPYERTDNRQGYANGYKPKQLQTRVGQLNLQVPQVRGFSFYPQSLEKGTRSEKALKLAIAEMYLKGVSTRKVHSITEALCGMDISSSQVSRISKELDEDLNVFRNRLLGEFSYVTLDALYLKVRHGGTVISMPCLIAYGVNLKGRREILGSLISLSEAEVHWREFLKSLVKRGLSGVRLFTSDDHVGLKAARRAVFPSVPWQRCQFHMSSNAQSYAPKRSMKSEIGQAMRDIFDSRDLDTALIMTDKVTEEFEKKAPAFVKWLSDNIDEGFTVYKFPREHCKKLRTSNGIERVNREIRRRERVAVMFPSEESAHRLVSGVLIEIHEEWVSGKRYLDMDLLNVDEKTKETA